MNVNWITVYNRAPGPPGRVAVLFAAGIVGTVSDLIAATREVYEAGVEKCRTLSDH